MSSNKQYAMYKSKYFVKILNDDSAKGYKVKIIRMKLWSKNNPLTTTGSPRWVSMTDLQKLTPEVVDIMVATNAI